MTTERMKQLEEALYTVLEGRTLPDDARKILEAAYYADPPADRTQSAQAVTSITIDFKQTTKLLDMFGNMPSEITLTVEEGHSGHGLYAHCTEYPEDGSEYLGLSSHDALPDPALALPTPKAEPAPIPKYQTPHDFKNFHRQLCARFGYVHDEQFWWRDLVSLIEHIAGKAQPAVEPVAWRLKDKERSLELGFDVYVYYGKSDFKPGIDPCELVDGLERLYTAPAPNALDAERWQFIRRKLCLTGNGDGTCSMHAINLPACIFGWPETSRVAEFCDSAIDAAIAAQSAQGGV